MFSAGFIPGSRDFRQYLTSGLLDFVSFSSFLQLFEVQSVQKSSESSKIQQRLSTLVASPRVEGPRMAEVHTHLGWDSGKLAQTLPPAWRKHADTTSAEPRGQSPACRLFFCQAVVSVLRQVCPLKWHDEITTCSSHGFCILPWHIALNNPAFPAMTSACKTLSGSLPLPCQHACEFNRV